MAKLIGQFVFEDNHQYSNYDYTAAQKREAAWLADVKSDLRKFHKNGKPGELVGEELRWQRADGYARYIITREKPFCIAHLNIGDGYQVEPETIRGFRLIDAKVQIGREAKLRGLFG